MDSCTSADKSGTEKQSQILKIRIANTLSILRSVKDSERGNFEDFCIFHLLMSRPDPEVDIAFLLMDRHGRGYIDIQDFKVSCAAVIQTTRSRLALEHI